MSKAILNIGYMKFVMDVDKAIRVMDLLGGVEEYEEKWRKPEEGGTTYHVFDTNTDRLRVTIMPDALYRMAKMAGKPESGN